MRETYRLQKNVLVNMLQQHDKCLALFFIYTGNELPEYLEVFEKMRAALKKLENTNW